MMPALDVPHRDAMVARAVSPRGEIVLRRRPDDGALELRVNGVFVMDTAHTETERSLGQRAVAALTEGADGVVLIGGLGLGFTLQEVLTSTAVTSVVVAEIEPAVVGWHRAGLVPQTAVAITDARVRIHASDVGAVVDAQQPGTLDVIALDVDNGPGYLVYDANASLYETDFLVRCRDALTREGALIVWSAAPASDFEDQLRAVFGSVTHTILPITLGSREETYSVYEAPAGPSASASASASASGA